ncbi:tungsten cofactor oxidoreducase radical SAM maturase [Desulfofundulus australicus DSM 11792]|uniref:Tungsten cofactor oxidoreducase radical SAM maturase n=1 Tax=Desulfofundulus australicus DSM 11792 TaxID=1121425 RepID=A0A1M4WEG8_9FIRM|nr:tungsten cofactor oxidoreductase radical SAM maturase [Desulfofundulus australicus]SHE79636.1 tungsten cofactor oxidoreducase radical SAM maturase [Desulfofundulus australicus DSM 11792]
MSPQRPISVANFKMGKPIVITREGNTTLPFDFSGYAGDSGLVDALCVRTEDGFLVLPRVPDVKKLYIEPTTICNFACTTCIRNSWEDPLAHMDWAVFERILDSLHRLSGLECVHFGGFGEPFSHPRLLDMLEQVKARGYRVEVITNGSLLNAEIINRLIDIKLDMIFVSLDGPDEEEYCRIRQGADFRGVMGNIHLLQEIKRQRGVGYPELGIEFVATKDNYHKLPRLGELVVKLKARRMIVTNVLPYNEAIKEQILYDMEDTEIPFDYQSLLLMIQAELPYMKLRTDRYCKFIEDKSMVINHRGLVSPCYALMHSYRCFIYGRAKEIRPFYLGDVKEKCLDEIWTDPAYINFRVAVKNFRFPSCTDCKFLEGCTMADDNEMDCWGNSPSCAECLWSRQIVACP